MMNEVKSEILDEKTEVNCINNNCNLIQYQGIKFKEINGDYIPYRDYVNVFSLGGNIYYSYNGILTTLTPLVEIDNSVYQISSLPLDISNSLNNEIELNKYRFYSKFSARFNKINNLQRYGLRFASNVPIRYEDYNYTVSGVYINENPEEYQITDLIIGDLRYSSVDLIESGFNIYYDKHDNILWIDLEDKSGVINLDPIENFLSQSDDGHQVWEKIPPTCQFAVSNTSTNIIHDSVTSNTESFGFFPFDTSAIPDDATINSANLYIYAHSYSSRYRVAPANLWLVGCGSAKLDYGTLGCEDAFTVSSCGNLDWNKVVGWKQYTIPIGDINITGETSIRLSNGWDMVDGSAEINWRASEYTGNSTDPYLKINYIIDIPDGVYPTIIWKNPTPENNTILNQNSIFLNTTIIDNSTTSAFFDWNYSLRGYWSMDSYSSTEVYDNSSFKNTLTFNGSKFDNNNISDGRFGNATTFDGVDDFLHSGDNSNFNFGTDDMTWSGWINTTHSGTDYVASFYGAGADLQYRIQNGKGRVYLRDGAGNYRYRDTSSNLNDGIWHFFLFTWDGSSDTLTLYVDSSVNQGAVTSSGAVGSLTPTENLFIGQRGDNNNYYNGSLDEFQIHNRILSEEEINASYNNAIYRLYHNFTNLNNGTYNYSAYAIDIGGLLNITSRTITLGGIPIGEIIKTVATILPFNLEYPYVFLNISNINHLQIIPDIPNYPNIILNDSNKINIIPNINIGRVEL